MSTTPPRFPLPLERVNAGKPKRAPALAPAPSRPTPRVVSADAISQRAPEVGVGLDSERVRARMVERLRAQGIRHPKVLDALNQVVRHRFLDTALVGQAYEDTPLPIGHGQTISSPTVVARMMELLFQGRNAHARASLGRLLEIGTGCGYQAAVLACVATQVVSIERVRPLYDKARDLLADIRADRIRLVFGDGRLGHAPNAPYDSIVSAAGGDDIPDAWLQQLAIGGRLVAPTRAADGRGQVLVVVDRDETGWSRSTHDAVRFVPLKSGTE